MNFRLNYKLLVSLVVLACLFFGLATPVLAKKKDRSAAAKASTSAKSKKKAAKAVAAPVASEPVRKKSLVVAAVSDIELMAVYQAISRGQSASALGQIEALLVKAPNYKLLHLLRADLLLMLSQKNTLKTTAGTAFALPPLSAGHLQRINQLQQEAVLRLNGQSKQKQLIAQPLVPRQLMKLADNEPFALVVDSQSSRLYVFQNMPNALPRLVTDYYVTQGAQGTLKLKEGDQRTPLGAYFINGPIKQKLPDLYGFGALNMDYPNAWDKRQGRTGHGIWLHGTPSETYARAPFASDGCVVLANPDVEMIFKLANNGEMPIVVVEKLDWVPASTIEKSKKPILEALEQWRGATETADLKVMAKSYSDTLNSEEMGKKMLTAKPSKITLSNITAIEYPSETDMVLMRFNQSNGQNGMLRKQQYWKKESGSWKIILETTL